jgi:hypothetical protein
MAVRLRARNAYEAIDLGYAMTLAWRRDLFPIWASVYVTAAVVINLLCFASPIIATLLIWWLKPAFDRVILHVLAGAAFGAPPTLASTWRSLPSLWWGNGLLAALTWRRIDSARSFSLPVTQLERQTGKVARTRRTALGREGRGAGMWLTLASANFEIIFVLSIYAFAEMFLPGDVGAINPFRWLTEPPPDWLQYVSNGLTALVVLLLEPFYVAGGFALYLNARTVLEGWDIELAFKRMSSRLRDVRARATQTADWVNDGRRIAKTISGAMMCLVVAIAFALVMPMSDALAQSCRLDGTDTEDDRSALNTVLGQMNDLDHETLSLRGLDTASAILTPETGATARAAKILADPMFGESRATWRIKYVGPGGEQKKKEPPNFEWLQKFGEWLSYALRALAWGLGAAAIVGLLYVLIRRLEGRTWQRTARGPDMLFGLDVRPESLPDDVAQAARQALQAGDTRLALSLLYRGALVSLITDGRFDISRGDTEGVCERHVAASYGGSKAEKPAYFSRLVNTWQRVAYSHELVGQVDVAPLIEAWSRYFSVARAVQGRVATPNVAEIAR